MTGPRLYESDMPPLIGFKNRLQHELIDHAVPMYRAISPASPPVSARYFAVEAARWMPNCPSQRNHASRWVQTTRLSCAVSAAPVMRSTVRILCGRARRMMYRVPA
jgi:hypothetical protein